MSAQQQGLLTQSDKMYSRVVAKFPDYFDALHFYGLFKYQQGQLNEAFKLVSKATKINPRSANAFNSLGVILGVMGRHVDAIASFNRALALDPNHVPALSNRGNSLNELGRYKDAVSSADRALAINAGYFEAYIPRGAALLKDNRHVEGLESYERSIKLNPNFPTAWLGRGNVLTALRRYPEAIASYDKALVLDPKLAGAWSGRGHVLAELSRHDEALASFERGLDLSQDLDAAWIGRGHILHDLKRDDEAFAAYDKALSIKPDLPYAEGFRLHAKMYLRDWRNFDADCARLISSVKSGKANTALFPFLAIPSSPADQLQCAKLWISKECPPSNTLVWQGERYSHDRIRVGYLSADFRDHPVAQALADLLEQHDRSRFMTIGLSIGHDDGSALRARLVKAFDQFYDVRLTADLEVARLIRELEVDILVKVAPHTGGSRLAILGHRPAPIQVNGFSAWTTGADFIDYVLADPQTLPFDEQPYFSEQIVHLPDSYFPNDSTQQISVIAPSRADQGLPENAFVFCGFNASYKFNPRTFDIWMSLLKRIEGSVLWLSQANLTAAGNLKREAAARGVDPSRLVFAANMPALSDHLARHRLADLFLDTLPYGAHTTAKDALWAGLPVLTCRGGTFVGRIATSLLHAVGLPDLVTNTFEQYEATALRLAQTPAELKALRDRLAANRLTTPVFDTRRLCRHFEAAYLEMSERQRRGEPPKQFAVHG